MYSYFNLYKNVFPPMTAFENNDETYNDLYYNINMLYRLIKKLSKYNYLCT